MPNFVDVCSPMPGDTVGRTFFTTGSAAFEGGGTPATITVTLFDNANNPIAVVSGANPVVINVPGGIQLYPWFASFAVGGDFPDCKISALIAATAGGNPQDDVENVDIENAIGGGGLLFP